MTSSPEPPSAELDLVRLAEIAVSSMARVDLCLVASGSHKNTLVAVKRLHDDVADDPEFVRMFRDEVWMTSALLHENVVRVIGWGEDPEGPYFATEFVRGVSVSRLMRTVFHTGEMFTERLIVSFASSVCRGLAAAHSLRAPTGELLNMVHRDLTPDNVLVSFDGDVKITDFGLAKAKRRTAMTMVGMVKGTREYMAPEQVLGKPIDARVDIFALGVMLFELFCGKRPFRARNARDLMRAIVDAPAPDLAKLRPGIHSVLVSLVQQCLTKEPSERFQTAVELDQQLTQWLQSHGYHENKEHLARFVRRNAMRQMRWCERAIAGEFAEGVALSAPIPSPWADEVRPAGDSVPQDLLSETETRVEVPLPGTTAESPGLAPSAVIAPAAGVPAPMSATGTTPGEGPDTQRDAEPPGPAGSEEAPTIMQRPEHAIGLVPAPPPPPAAAPESAAPVDSSLTLPSARVPNAGMVPAPPAPAVAPAPAAAVAPAPVAAAAPAAAVAPAPATAPTAAPAVAPASVVSKVSVPSPPPRPPTTAKAPKPPKHAAPPQSAAAPVRSSVAPKARTAPGPEGAAVLKQARETIKEASRLAAQADRAAGLARRAAERAREAADNAAEAAARAEAAATAASLAQEALELVKTGDPEAARDTVEKAEQFRRESMPPPPPAPSDSESS